MLADRNVFSLFVLNLEAQLFHVNFEHVTHMVVDMTHTQVMGLMDVSSVCVRVSVHVHLCAVHACGYMQQAVGNDVSCAQP